MSREMPSPFGHALAGAAIGFVAAPSTAITSTTNASRSSGPWFYPLLGYFIAVLPDLDLLTPLPHRGPTHSLGATALLSIVVVVVTGKVTGRSGWRPDWRLALALAAAYASHLLLDWLGTDHFRSRGIELFWPFSTRYYISELDWFPETERRLRENPDALAINLRAFFTELFVLGPMAGAAWWLTRRRRSRVLTSVPDSQPRPSA